VSPRFVAAPRLTRPLSHGARAALGLATATFAAQQLGGLAVLAPLAVYALLLALVLSITGRMSHLRSAVVESADRAQMREREDRQRRERMQALLEQSGTEGSPLEALETNVESETTAAKIQLEWFGREGVSIALALGGAVGLVASLIAFSSGFDVPPTGSVTLLVALGLGCLGFVLLVASRTVAAIPSEQLPESAGLAQWLRGGQWMAVLLGLALLTRSVPVLSPAWSRWPAFVLLGLSALCGLELFLRGPWLFLRRQPSWDICEVPVRLLTLATLFHGRSPLHGALEAAERYLGLSLHTAWAIGFVRRSAFPLVAGLGLLLWASTTLVVVQPHEQGIRLRFGRLATSLPVGPGLHLKLPWPLETVDRYPVRRVQTLGLGYSGPAKDSLLWTRAHSGEEYKLLLGDGRELISVDATVAYRIRDVLAFALGFQNPREALGALAYGLLLRVTVGTDLDRLLTADRAPFARRFAADLQKACDAHGLGLEIVHVSFVSLHPPVGIAAAYEDVVSAEIERVTRAARARAEREGRLPAAQAEAAREIQGVKANAARRLADARGTATAFRGIVTADRAAPDLFRFRRRLEAIESALTDRSLFVIDRSLRTGTGDLWIDLRPRGADAPRMENR
jgi:regulator of protease activity HflC (stomatin/prohibitin superfamily)